MYTVGTLQNRRLEVIQITSNKHQAFATYNELEKVARKNGWNIIEDEASFHFQATKKGQRKVTVTVTDIDGRVVLTPRI